MKILSVSNMPAICFYIKYKYFYSTSSSLTSPFSLLSTSPAMLDTKRSKKPPVVLCSRFGSSARQKAHVLLPFLNHWSSQST
ncbi:hypothetical protein FR483_n632R [Paramecium bursaria Chlorella virus FR483]|uniref:Uncharacterized protein n632R n=1 Tax=Paramecium bursaria Chlorella virus FR483 TaxID=399781 RepID=A7J7Y6_PBCVF|nr:hypothetical protein FR483_n632R [Paramecium bursaria Chlorella virus FR483]ABT15917.1 hypothetical protein FR483_n632R [Paramecium bursaria Chlorella virus FR483]